MCDWRAEVAIWSRLGWVEEERGGMSVDWGASMSESHLEQSLIYYIKSPGSDNLTTESRGRCKWAETYDRV